MDMNKKSSFRRHASGNIRKKGDKDRLAAELAPLEEQDKSAAEHQIGGHLNSIKSQADPEYGAIIVDNENLKVPTDIMETRDETRFLGIEPVVLVVLIIMLSFIAFIAWQISLMPPR
jgi:hypothetical protein